MLLEENLLLSQNYCKVTEQLKIILGTFCHWCHTQFVEETEIRDQQWALKDDFILC
jgi:hypothetical protein